MGMMKIFSILLTFYHKLVLREVMFATAASLIPYFAIIISPCYDQVTNSCCFNKLLFRFFFFFFFAKREIWKKDVKKFFDKVSMFIIHESYER